MDRSLDEIISEHPAPRPRGPPREPREPRSEPRRGAPPPRAPRREEYPRDGVRKFRRDEPVNMNEYGNRRLPDRAREYAYSSGSDWVHDRFEEDRRERFDRDAYDGRGARDDRSGRNGRAEEGGTRIRVDNLHYEISERDLQELFERIGPVVEARLNYDRADRSTGTAFVTYQDPRDAREAMHEFDGQSAKGQIIKLALLPSAPAGPAKGSLFDRIQVNPRSLADRITSADPRDERNDMRGGGRRRPRSESPRRRTAVPEHIDRYMPGSRGSRSPIGRRGTPREGGRRLGQRRDEGRGPGGPPRGPREGGGERKGKQRKTAEELDAEMNDYFGGGGTGDAAAAQNNGAGDAAATDDVDMVE